MEINIKRLDDITDVQFGLYKKRNKNGNVKYLTSSHFDDYLNPTQFDSNSFISIDETEEKFLLRPNDVILAGKGQRIFAWAYDDNFGDVVPSSLFYILRPHEVEVNGYYLASVLNSSRKQYELDLIGSGSSITSIAKKELLDLKIPLPSIKKQLRIVTMLKLLDEEILIANDILEKKRSLRKGVLNELITNKIKV